MINWDKEFSKGDKSLSIQNINPSPSIEGSRNIFKDDKEEIMKAANKYGYIIISHPKAKIVSFLKKEFLISEKLEQ